MGKQCRAPSHLVSKDGISEDPTWTSQVYNLSDKKYREEMLRMLRQLKEMMQWTATKNQENMWK